MVERLLIVTFKQFRQANAEITFSIVVFNVNTLVKTLTSAKRGIIVALGTEVFPYSNMNAQTTATNMPATIIDERFWFIVCVIFSNNLACVFIVQCV